VPQDEMMPWHGPVGRLRLAKIALLDCFAEGGLGEEDVVNFGTDQEYILGQGNGNEQEQSEQERASAFHSSLQIFRFQI
jgi:hypothetical protein